MGARDKMIQALVEMLLMVGAHVEVSSGIWCAVESRKTVHASSSVKDKEKKIDNFTQWEQLPL